jgi:hypothetical protein
VAGSTVGRVRPNVHGRFGLNFERVRRVDEAPHGTGKIVIEDCQLTSPPRGKVNSKAVTPGPKSTGLGRNGKDWHC